MDDRLLDKIDSPADLKTLSISQLIQLSQEIRAQIISTISKTGGHLASSLGAVDLTVALHYVLDAPIDAIVWDVGHQAYAHKLLTGRRDKFQTIRQLGGLSGFPSKDESPYDAFTVGHSSTSISTALGLVTAGDITNQKRRVVVVIGDAALAGGMSFEALNHAGHLKKNLIITLNDNELSISPSVGALSKSLNRMMTNPVYNKIRKDLENLILKIPKFGFRAFKAARKLEEGLKHLLVPGIVFEELGFRYFGPIDGHDINVMITTLNNILKMDGPVLIHVVTKKGKGYKPAETKPGTYHSSPVFEIDTGESKGLKEGMISYTQAFSEELVRLAQADDSIIAITAAMSEGTGLQAFAQKFPKRFFDVGIAEEHAVGFAAGLAKGGTKPVVAIYSTFLQRSYDQLIHDICLQNFHVVFCLDRAGLVEDGPTHHGVFDIAFLRHLPRMTLMAPRNTEELKKMLDFAIYRCSGPVAIRYPKGYSYADKLSDTGPIEPGRAEILREGKDAAIFAVGNTSDIAMQAADLLRKDDIFVSVYNARFIKPIDEQLILSAAKNIKKIVSIEEGVVDGGFGSSILETLEKHGVKDVEVKRFGLPNSFIEHGKKELLLARHGLTADSLCGYIKSVRKRHSIWHT